MAKKAKKIKSVKANEVANTTAGPQVWASFRKPTTSGTIFMFCLDEFGWVPETWARTRDDCFSAARNYAKRANRDLFGNVHPVLIVPITPKRRKKK